MKTEAEAGRAIALYADTVRRICFMHLNHHSDVEDVFQDVFLKYVLHEPVFESDDHERAWLIRVAINACRDTTRSLFRRKTCSLEQLEEYAVSSHDENRPVLEAVLSLPERYRNVIYLHYYEGYSGVEISKILNKKENTIYALLSRAKSKLKLILGGELFDQ